MPDACGKYRSRSATVNGARPQVWGLSHISVTAAGAVDATRVVARPMHPARAWLRSTTGGSGQRSYWPAPASQTVKGRSSMHARDEFRVLD
jgi:hypothetical protein